MMAWTAACDSVGISQVELRSDAGDGYSVTAGWLVSRQAAGVVDFFDDEFLAFGAGVKAVTAVQALGEELAQITFAGEMFGRMEDRVMEFAEFDFQIAFLGDFQRVADGLGRFAEARLHFLGGAEIKLLRHVGHALGVAQQGLRADADEAIVRVGMAFLDVMDVVGGDKLQAEFLRPRE